MAVVSPFVPSPGGLKSTFSPYTDSPSSPIRYRESFPGPNRSSFHSDSLAPPPSPYPQHIDPSPTDSNGTEGTDIEEEAQEEVQDQIEDEPESEPELELEPGPNPEPEPKVETRISQSRSPDSLVKIDTSVPIRSRSNSDDAPPSVIHAPSGFGDFTTTSVRNSVERSKTGTASPSTPDAALGPDDKRISVTSPLNTDIPPDRTFDRQTPRAQTRLEAEEEWKRRSRRTSSLKDIPEAFANQTPDNAREDNDSQQTMRVLTGPENEIAELRTALNECWTFCNTLASLSSNHRQRIFNISGIGSTQEHAWQSCWRLCQKLYESHDQPQSQALPTLELCREFCQALFDVRQRGDEASDSVLRVSFEMNNHLYNTHDRNLPDAFRERTLDFYVTICHRLMKQRTSLVHETDSLLRACWSLAEMLFNLRQAGREFRKPDDELLASAVQACWDLCDLFREGWNQARPERRTPRPSQTSFPPSVQHYPPSLSERPSSSMSSSSYHDAPSLPPETPTTIFDDATTTSSPDSISVPNILILGPASNTSGSMRGVSHHDRWSSNASTLSDYNSESTETSSQHTSSTARAGSDNAHLMRLRCLLIKAALNAGFSRGMAQSLPAFVKTLPATAFGILNWQTQALKSYRKLVLVDQSVAAAANMPSRKLTAKEVAKAVAWLSRNEQWAWIGDLYRFVFGFTVDEAESRGGFIQT